MARLTQDPITPRRSVSNPDSLTDLNRLLARLQATIVHADAERERRLRTSEHERTKAGINLEYARTLLTKLEQDAAGIKIHSRRQETQADLNRKRDVFEQISERLRELEEMSVDSDEEDDDEDDTEEGEDLLAGIANTQRPADSHGKTESRDPAEARRREEDDDDDQLAAWEEEEPTIVPESRRQTVIKMPSGPEAPDPQPAQTTAPPPTSTTTTSEGIRARNTAASETQQQQQAPMSTTTARSKLLGTDRAGNDGGGDPATTSATTEAILDHQRAEQDQLTESLVKMASALKASSQAFSSSLEGEKTVLDAAGSGLARNETGLESAARRMGALRRMSEGKGWWGRLMLYAWIAGLAVFAVLLVFVLPKLRF